MELDIEREAAALRQMPMGQLCERYAELFGEPTRTRHRMYLVRKIAWKLQARAEGDLSERVRRRAEELARGTELRVMPPKAVEAKQVSLLVTQVALPMDGRLPAPGTAIDRTYKGRKIRLLVQTDGFDYEGRRYKSLSAVAKEVTGSHVNGYRFFGLEGKP
jgi:Protein of unknown function (DUF2924)